MKAFVIKNKEGKYLGIARDYSHYWTDNIFHSYHFIPFSESHDVETAAEEYRDINYPDCEVVEITIAEIDNSKREYNETIKYIETTEPDKVAEYIDNLEQQLAKKDKEINELKFIQRNITGLIEKVSEKRENQLRHEICEKIRNWLKSRATKYIVGKKFVYEFLDQIEQGEE